MTDKKRQDSVPQLANNRRAREPLFWIKRGLPGSTTGVEKRWSGKSSRRITGRYSTWSSLTSSIAFSRTTTEEWPLAFMNCVVNFVDYCEKLMDEQRPCLLPLLPHQRLRFSWRWVVAPICYEVLCGLTSALYIDGAEDGIDRIEAEGYPDHLCSTQKGTAGYLLLEVVPKPDFLVKSATPCDSSNKLYEWTSVKFDVPLIMLETPYYKNERGTSIRHRRSQEDDPRTGEAHGQYAR